MTAKICPFMNRRDADQLCGADCAHWLAEESECIWVIIARFFLGMMKEESQ